MSILDDYSDDDTCENCKYLRRQDYTCTFSEKGCVKADGFVNTFTNRNTGDL